MCLNKSKYLNYFHFLERTLLTLRRIIFFFNAKNDENPSFYLHLLSTINYKLNKNRKNRGKISHNR